MAKVLAYSLLLFLSVLAALELSARVAQPLLVRAVPAYYYRQYFSTLIDSSPVLIWTGRPRATAVIKNSNGEKIDYRINALGWRGADFAPLTRATNALVLGDSISFGTGVKESSVYSVQLEKNFDNMNVWNLGMMGYAPDQYLLLAQRWITAFPWSFLLLQLSNNDLADVAGHTWHNMNSGTGIPAALEPPAEHFWFSGVSEAWDLLAYWNLQRSESARTDAELRGGMYRLLFSLKNVLNLAKERKIPVLLLQATDWGQGMYGEKIAAAYQDGVRVLSSEFKVPLVEMHDAELLPFPDLHWTEATHKKAAGKLLTALKSMTVETASPAVKKNLKKKKRR